MFVPLKDFEVERRMNDPKLNPHPQPARHRWWEPFSPGGRGGRVRPAGSRSAERRAWLRRRIPHAWFRIGRAASTPQEPQAITGAAPSTPGEARKNPAVTGPLSQQVRAKRPGSSTRTSIHASGDGQQNVPRSPTSLQIVASLYPRRFSHINDIDLVRVRIVPRNRAGSGCQFRAQAQPSLTRFADAWSPAPSAMVPLGAVLDLQGDDRT